MAEPSKADEDPVLAMRMAAGDQVAFSILMARHRPRLRMLALRMTSRSADAEDIVQDAFIAVWRHADKFASGEIPFGAYVTRIVVNRAIDRARRARLRRLVGLEQAVDPADDLPGADRDIDARAEVAAVARDMERLPARQKAVILMIASGEWTVAEIAKSMELSVGAVEQLLVRARRSLRQAAVERARNQYE